MADPQRRLYRVNLKSPNAALADFLRGPQCMAEVEKHTAELFAIYESMLPVRTERLHASHGRPAPGHLKRSAYYRIGRGGFGAEKDRWFGWVGNTAAYAAVLEWGSARRGIQGQHTLRNAGAILTNSPLTARPIPPRTMREARFAEQKERSVRRKIERDAGRDRRVAKEKERSQKAEDKARIERAAREKGERQARAKETVAQAQRKPSRDEFEPGREGNIEYKEALADWVNLQKEIKALDKAPQGNVDQEKVARGRAVLEALDKGQHVVDVAGDSGSAASSPKVETPAAQKKPTRREAAAQPKLKPGGPQITDQGEIDAMMAIINQRIAEGYKPSKREKIQIDAYNKGRQGNKP